MTLAPTPSDSPPAWFAWATSRAARSGFVYANGSRLHYLAWNAEEITKPALLFVHGFRAHARWWDFVAPFFVDTHRVFAIDLSGMGDSAWRERYSAPLLSHDVIALIEALGLAPATVVAHSYGGLCSLRAASERSDLFHRLVVLDTFVFFEDDELPRDATPITASRIYPDYASARERYRLLPDQPVPIPCLIDHVAAHSLREIDGGFRWKFDGRLQGPDTHLCDGEAMLGRITAPVVYVYGTQSALVTAEHAARIVNALPNPCGPLTIAGGHHHLMLDQPLALIDMLQTLLGTQDRDTDAASIRLAAASASCTHDTQNESTTLR